MFADTLTITINAVAKQLVRVNQDGYSSEYRLIEANGEFRLRIRNTSYKDKVRGNITVSRHNLELVQTIYGAAGAPNTTRKAYAVFEKDQGDGITDSSKMTVGAVGFLTEANVTKMLNWES